MVAIVAAMPGPLFDKHPVVAYLALFLLFLLLASLFPSTRRPLDGLDGALGEGRGEPLGEPDEVYEDVEGPVPGDEKG